MKVASSPLKAFLAASPTLIMADLYQLTLTNSLGYQTSQNFYWTDADVNLSYGGNTYLTATDQGGTPLLERGEIRTARGLEVSTTDLTIFAGDTAQVLGIDVALAAHNGMFDNAEVLITRVVMPTFGDCLTLGGCVLFDGEVASVDARSTEVVLHVASKLQDLTVQMPRTLFLPQCANSFCDASCGLSLASVTQTGNLTSGSTTTSLNGLPSKAANYWQNGVITFTSGPNAGVSAAISSYAAGGAAVLVIPLPFTPGATDAYSVYPGCAKTIPACLSWGSTTGPNFVVGQQYQILTTGGTSFTTIGAASNTVGTIFTATGVGTGITGTASSNLGNYRGTPFVPPAESGL